MVDIDSIKQYINTLILTYDKVFVLEDVIYDHDDDDYYMIVCDYNGKRLKIHILYNWYPLKHRLHDDEYFHIVRHWNSQHGYVVESFEECLQYALKLLNINKAYDYYCDACDSYNKNICSFDDFKIQYINAQRLNKINDILTD